MSNPEIIALANKILTAPQRAWFYEADLEIYIRPARQGLWPLQIPNVSAVYPGKGAMTALLNELEPRATIQFENVVNERFVQYLLRRGYKITNEQIGYYVPIMERECRA